MRLDIERNTFSILCPEGQETVAQATTAPAFFHDLNLDQIVEALADGREDYNLTPFFYSPPTDLRTITYRQQVMHDLENDDVMAAVQTFSKHMKQMRAELPGEKGHYYSYERERCILDGAESYCQAVMELADSLAGMTLTSDGMQAFRDYLIAYAGSHHFGALQAEAASVLSELSSIRYCLLIKEDTVTVRCFEDEEDYSVAVERTFEKFRQAPAKDYRFKNLTSGGMNHIQAQVVEQLARLYPDIFDALENFCEAHSDYLDDTISRFDREVQFYIAYLSYVDKLRQAGLSFCYPQLSRESKEIDCRDSFDLALAVQLLRDDALVVTNDFSLSGSERILVVSGPNQGGKTTFARMFGQVHYLARLGVPVPGTQARLFLFDHLFTHFEREEDIETLRGKLAEELVQIRRVLDQATPNSIVIMNEMFSSTMLKDAVYLSKEIMTKVSDRDLIGVCVTFLDELASFNEKTVSMVGGVDPENPEVRTYKLARMPANGLAYALAIAQKYHVTHDWLRKRMSA